MSGSGVYYLDENGERQEAKLVSDEAGVKRVVRRHLSTLAIGARIAKVEYPDPDSYTKAIIYFDDGAYVEGDILSFGTSRGQ